MSIGESTMIVDLGELPANFKVKNYVKQTSVLQNSDAFITLLLILG